MENIKLENLTLIEFLELISGYNEIKEYTIKIRATDTKTGIEPLEVTGRINDFKELNKNLPQLEEFIQELENENNHSYTEIEIHNYLKKLTDNFSKDEVKIVLKEMEVFENMTLFEEMDIITTDTYTKNGWEIPTYKKTTAKFGEQEFFNYKEMRNKVFPYLCFNFYNAKSTLTNKLNSHTEKEKDLSLLKKTLDAATSEKMFIKQEKVLEGMINKIEKELTELPTKEQIKLLKEHLNNQNQSIVTNPFNGIIEKNPNNIQDRFIKLLEFKLERLELYYIIELDHNKIEYKHNDIFCNNGFELFEYLLEHFVKPKGKRGHHKDVLFCYHKLYKNTPQYIHRRTQPFLDWYNKEYSDDISQTKTFDEVKNDNRERLYSNILDLFKQQK